MELFKNTKQLQINIKTIINLRLFNSESKENYFFYRIYDGFIPIEKEMSISIGKFQFTLYFTDIKITSNQIEYNYLLESSFPVIIKEDIEEIINLGWQEV